MNVLSLCSKLIQSKIKRIYLSCDTPSKHNNIISSQSRIEYITTEKLFFIPIFIYSEVKIEYVSNNLESSIKPTCISIRISSYYQRHHLAATTTSQLRSRIQMA